MTGIELKMPENYLKADLLESYSLQAEDIRCDFDNSLNLAGSFIFYQGEGRFSYDPGHPPSNSEPVLKFNIKRLNLSTIMQDISQEILVSGAMNVEGSVKFGVDSPEIDVLFRSERRRGVRQVMNFGAVKMLASIGSGSHAANLGKSDFAYGEIAGRIQLSNGYLTLTGLAGTHDNYEYLIRGGTFGGINMSIDKSNQRIRLDYLVNRITEQMKDIQAEIK